MSPGRRMSRGNRCSPRRRLLRPPARPHLQPARFDPGVPLSHRPLLSRRPSLRHPRPSRSTFPSTGTRPSLFLPLLRPHLSLSPRPPRPPLRLPLRLLRLLPLLHLPLRSLPRPLLSRRLPRPFPRSLSLPLRWPRLHLRMHPRPCRAAAPSMRSSPVSATSNPSPRPLARHVVSSRRSGRRAPCVLSARRRRPTPRRRPTRSRAHPGLVGVHQKLCRRSRLPPPTSPPSSRQRTRCPSTPLPRSQTSSITASRGSRRPVSSASPTAVRGARPVAPSRPVGGHVEVPRPHRPPRAAVSLQMAAPGAPAV